MSDVKLTEHVAAVLRGVAAGQVKNIRSGRSEVQMWTWIAGANRMVNREMRILRDAGLAELPPAEVGQRATPWKLTEAGEKWLAENEESN